MATTRNKRPILSDRSSAFQRVKWPYLDNILDTAEVVLHARSVACDILTRTVNPRGGGSIPPLATIQNQSVDRE